MYERCNTSSVHYQHGNERPEALTTTRAADRLDPSHGFFPCRYGCVTVRMVRTFSFRRYHSSSHKKVIFINTENSFGPYLVLTVLRDSRENDVLDFDFIRGWRSAHMLYLVRLTDIPSWIPPWVRFVYRMLSEDTIVCTTCRFFPSFFFKSAQELEKAITDRTKIIFFNNPHNPSGKMYTREEMLQLSELVLKHPNLYVVR